MKTIIHVNKSVIRNNVRTGASDPPITVKAGGRNTYTRSVRIEGPSELVYRPDKPLSCGARLWLETTAPVICDAGVDSRDLFSRRPR
jgi:hypothetical protein